jgi:predicted secreted protein
MKMKKALWLMISILALSRIQATDATTSTILGFSPDGRYMAFEQSGVFDGSGFAHCTLFILDVDLNDYVIRPVKSVQEDENSPDPVKEVRRKSLAFLTKYNIVSGVNPGTPLPFEMKRNAEGELVQFSHDGMDYQLILYLRPANELSELTELSVKMIDLRLRRGNETRILQKDKKIPESRGPAFFYSIRSITVFQKKLAVEVEYYRPGFEGPDTRQIMVTGLLF